MTTIEPQRRSYWLSGAEAMEQYRVKRSALLRRAQVGLLRTTRSGPGRGILLYWVPDLVDCFG